MTEHVTPLIVYLRCRPAEPKASVAGLEKQQVALAAWLTVQRPALAILREITESEIDTAGGPYWLKRSCYARRRTPAPTSQETAATFNQGSANNGYRPIASSAPAAPEALLGIFWMVPERAAGVLVADSVPLERRRALRRCLTYPRGHYEVWTRWQRLVARKIIARGPPLAILSHEYDAVPRGRVVFENPERRVLGPCALNHSAVLSSASVRPVVSKNGFVTPFQTGNRWLTGG